MIESYLFDRHNLSWLFWIVLALQSRLVLSLQSSLYDTGDSINTQVFETWLKIPRMYNTSCRLMILAPY